MQSKLIEIKHKELAKVNNTNKQTNKNYAFSFYLVFRLVYIEAKIFMLSYDLSSNSFYYLTFLFIAYQ